MTSFVTPSRSSPLGIGFFISLSIFVQYEEHGIYHIIIKYILDAVPAHPGYTASASRMLVHPGYTNDDVIGTCCFRASTIGRLEAQKPQQTAFSLRPFGWVFGVQLGLQ